tara:strand:- start:26084 stop:26266 length:183 start_codon:yes stop_codon:yes gene_type:complete
VVAREAFVGEYIVLVAAHQLRKLGMAQFKRVGQFCPEFFRRYKRVLIEGGSERRGDDRAC